MKIHKKKKKTVNIAQCVFVGQYIAKTSNDKILHYDDGHSVTALSMTYFIDSLNYD